jgi:hypothetical protein
LDVPVKVLFLKRMRRCKRSNLDTRLTIRALQYEGRNRIMKGCLGDEKSI